MLDIVKQFEKELHRQGKSPHTVRAYSGRVGGFTMAGRTVRRNRSSFHNRA
jgi:hypothetical protein